MEPNSSHLTSETLDLWLLSALSDSERKNAEAHLENCASCQKEFTQRQADQAAFRQFVFPKTVAAVEEKLQARRRFSWKKGWAMALALSVAATVVLLVPSDEDTPYVGKKGVTTPWVEIQAARPGASQFNVHDGVRLRPKDRLGFVLEPGDKPYVLVTSQDGAGQFSVYFPFGQEESAQLSSERQTLPTSIELDAVLGKETLWVVFSSHPLKASTVKEAMSGKPSKSLEQATVRILHFEKEAL